MTNEPAPPEKTQDRVTPARRSRAMAFILLLGLVSLFGDVTYEGAHSFLGPYLSILGASAAAVGFATGLGDFVGYSLRLLSGWFADRTGQYWLMTFIGYALNLLAVPLLALAGRWEVAAVLVVLERFGKAIRTPSRDTMLSHATNVVGRGWGFGVHEAMDQIGAILGPLLMSLVIYLKLGYREGYALLAIPAGLALLCLVVARINFPRPRLLESQEAFLSEKKPRLNSIFWLYSAFIGLAVFGFANFQLISYHFNAAAVVPDVQIPLFFAIAMGVDGVFALLVGRLYDRLGLSMLLAAPLLTIPIPFLAFSQSYGLAVGAVVLWGAVMGIQETIMRAAVADLTHISRRGFGFGIFNTIYGLALLAGNTLMGFLYGFNPTWIAYPVVATEIASLPFILAIIRRRRVLESDG